MSDTLLNDRAMKILADLGSMPISDKIERLMRTLAESNRCTTAVISSQYPDQGFQNLDELAITLATRIAKSM